MSGNNNRRPLNVHPGMRNKSIAERALVNAYRANPGASASNIVKNAMNRVNRAVKNNSRKNRIKAAFSHVSANALKSFKVNEVKASSISTNTILREMKLVIKELNRYLKN